MAELCAEEPLSNISENSFVILGQGSLPPDLSDDPAQKSVFSQDEFQMKESNTNNSLAQSVLSDTSSLVEGNVQDKLIKLLNENCTLKQTLAQNNSAIKSQLDTFIMWQQEVLKTHQNHKEKFLETKELILKLRAENENLKRQLAETSVTSLATNMNGSGRENVAANVDVENMRKEIQKLQKHCKELMVSNENLSSEKYLLVTKLKEAEKKFLESSKELEDALRENNFFKQKIYDLESNTTENYSLKSLPNSEARAQISNLLKQLEEEKEKVMKLNEVIQMSKKNKEKLNTSDDLKDFLDNMTESFDKQTKRFNSLISWVSVAEENLNILKNCQITDSLSGFINSEKGDSENHLQQEANIKEKQESIQEIHEHFSKLLVDYKELQEKLSLIKNISSNVQKYKVEIESLSRQLQDKNKELTDKEEECNELKDRLEKLNSESEEIALLKVQVQIYQNDFNDERAARERLDAEKEEMAEQIRQLQNKIEILEKDQSNKPENSVSPAPKKEKPPRYVCPKCMFSFSSLERCQEHVDECINIHMYP